MAVDQTFENTQGVIERYRSGECGGVARVGVNLKSSEIEWHWKEEEESIIPSGVGSAGEVGSGDGSGELRPPSASESVSH